MPVIGRDEVLLVAEELDLAPANVQRDYVFGWLLAGIFAESRLGDSLALKGGNALRKGYFAETRFSDDLDFTTAGAVAQEYFFGYDLTGGNSAPGIKTFFHY